MELVGKNRFLERLALSRQALVDDEHEEAPQLLGSRKNVTGEDSLELSANRGLRQVATRFRAGVRSGTA